MRRKLPATRHKGGYFLFAWRVQLDFDLLRLVSWVVMLHISASASGLGFFPSPSFFDSAIKHEQERETDNALALIRGLQNSDMRTAIRDSIIMKLDSC